MMRLIDAATVRALLPMDRCIALMADAFRAAADPGTEQPIRQAVRRADGRGLMSMMPGRVSQPDLLGIKVVSVFPGNFGTVHGSHQGIVLLFEPENGCPVAILDGREVTAIRTAAATAFATDLLARRDARTMAVFGYGEQARTHIEALSLVRDFETILIWGRDAEKAALFAAGLADELGLPVRAEPKLEIAAAADILCTVTAAENPFLTGALLRDGQHINIVGSSIPTTAEVDGELLLRSRLFVDYLPSALALGGEIRRAMEAGVITADHVVGSVGDVLEGRADGRQSDAQITAFKSLGMIAEDLIAADHVMRAAQRAGLGTCIDW